VAYYSTRLLRMNALPLAVGFLAAVLGLCVPVGVFAQTGQDGMTVESAGPITSAGAGAIQLGDTSLLTSYNTSRLGQENGQFSGGRQRRTLFDGSAWLFDAQYNVDTSDIRTMGLNVGGGFRTIRPGFLGSGAPRIFGATLWYDGINTELANYFNQIGISLESLGERWDFRANANLPVGERRKEGAPILTDEIGYTGYYLSQVTQIPVDQTVSVVDLEAACRVRNLDAWLFAGAYAVKGGEETEAGFKAGARGNIGNDMHLQLQVTHDEYFDTNVTFGLVWYPGRTPLHGRPAGWLENRLREPVRRNDYIAVRRQWTTGGVPLSNADGEIRIVHVDSSAAPAGDGTYEKPFNSLDDVYTGSQDGDIILVHSESEFTGESIVLRDRQRFLGEGNNVRHSITTDALGTINLPETSVGALAKAIPILRTAPATAITLASASTTHESDETVSQNEVSNISIDGGARGIASAAVGIASANINHVTIANTTSHGIELARFEETLSDTSATQSRFSPTINEVTFDSVGGNDIQLTGTTTETTYTENIQISNVDSTDGSGRGIYIVGNKSSVTIQDYTYNGGATGTGGIVFSATEAGASVSRAEIEGGAGVGIEIAGNSEGTFSFSDVTITDTGGVAFNLNGGTATVTFAGKITQTNNVAAVTIGGEHTGSATFRQFTSGEGAIEATNGTGLQFDNADGTYTFQNDGVLNGGDAGIDILNDSEGTFNFSSGTAITNPTGIAFNLTGSSAAVTYNGTITDTVDTAAQAVAITNNTGDKLVTFTGAITVTGDAAGTAEAFLIDINADGTFQFNGAVDLDMTAAAQDGITISDNDTAVSVSFSNLNIETATGDALTATGGGALQITGSTNKITTTSGTALNLANMSINSSGVNFQSVSSNGSATAIVLNTLTGSGTVSIGAGGSTPGDGGTIQNTTGDAISITNAANVSLNNMEITGAGGDGIHMSHTTGAFRVTVDGCTIDSSTGQGIDLVASSSGTTRLTVTDTNIAQGNAQSAMSVVAQSGTTNVLVQGNNMSNSGANSTFYAQANNAAVLNATVGTATGTTGTGNTFSNGADQAFEMQSTGSSVVRLNLLDNQGSSANMAATPFLLTRTNGSFGIVLLNPADPATTQCVNERNGGTGKYANYPTNWRIDLGADETVFNNLNEGDVPRP